MEKLKKLFGDINLTWKKLILFAIIAGAYTAVMALIPIVKDTSFSDLVATFEVWILFGILIIMNSKSAKDSALKCFVFFLISQPLIYLIQDFINNNGMSLFRTYYKYWFMWTLATIVMGFVGYYMKKDKWWGLLILTPILLLLVAHYSSFLRMALFSFPRHILTTIFCFVTLLLYPLVIFNNKKVKIAGLIISICLIIVGTILAILNPLIYDTTLLLSGGKSEINFDDTCKAYFVDNKFGELYFNYEEGIETWALNVRFKKGGQTEFVLEDLNGEKNVYKIDIRRNTYKIEKKEEENLENNYVQNNEVKQNENKKDELEWNKDNVKMIIKDDSITNTNAILIIEDKNQNPKSWGVDFEIQISAGENKWEDLIEKENMTWIEIAMMPNENGVTEMQLDWSKMYGKLNKGIYRVVKNIGVSKIYSEPFEIK